MPNKYFDDICTFAANVSKQINIFFPFFYFCKPFAADAVDPSSSAQVLVLKYYFLQTYRMFAMALYQKSITTTLLLIMPSFINVKQSDQFQLWVATEELDYVDKRGGHAWPSCLGHPRSALRNKSRQSGLGRPRLRFSYIVCDVFRNWRHAVYSWQTSGMFVTRRETLWRHGQNSADDQCNP